MGKAIIDYQNAYKEITEVLSKNENILAIFIFGSMVTGDLWEESDIDLFVICKDEFEKVRDVYSEVGDIPVHIKFLSKKSFMESYYETGKKGTIKHILRLSKLIHSIDNEISTIYDKNKYLDTQDKGTMNLVYLGEVLKDMGVCKKYLHTGGVYTAYEVLIRVLDNVSKLFLNLNGYTVSKDAFSMACNLSDSFNNQINELFSSPVEEENIKKILDFLEGYINNNLVKSTEILLEFLRKDAGHLSSYDIKNSYEFKNFDVKVEDILKLLYKKEILLKDVRDFKDPYGNILAKENVYKLK